MKKISKLFSVRNRRGAVSHEQVHCAKNGYIWGTTETDLKSAMIHMDVSLKVAQKVKTASFPGQ